MAYGYRISSQLLPVEEDRISRLFRDTAKAFNFAAAAPPRRSNIVQAEGSLLWFLAQVDILSDVGSTLSPKGAW